MAVYIQHGHAKSGRMTTAVGEGYAQGVIFGAKHEQPDRLDDCIQELRTAGECEVLFDPQFYVSTLIPANDRYLVDYPYYKPGRTLQHFINLSQVRRYVRQTLGFQIDHGFDRLISPSVIFDTFDDRWYQIALTLAAESIEYYQGLTNPPPLLLSFIFSEAALGSATEVDAFLDLITLWEVNGFYLIVAREDGAYSQRFGDGRFAHLLYLVHVLGDRNGFDVICGYTDFCGLPLRAAGATTFATGWFQGLRQFHRKAFLQKKPGGAPARLRYSSGPLYNSILLSELDQIAEVGALDTALSAVPLDRVIRAASRPIQADWSLQISEQHHWQTLGALDGTLADQVRQDIPMVLRQLQDASGLYTLLKARGVGFERTTDADHLTEWIAAIRSFRALARV